MTSKTCTKCGETKPLGDFHRDNSRSSGRNPWCKVCRGIQRKKSSDANRQNPPTPPAFKVCAQCGKKKPHTEFAKSLSVKCGLSSACKKCLAVTAKKVYVPGQNRDRILRRSFGIDSEQYESMLKVQGGKCAICGSGSPGRKGMKHLCIDHNHETGKIRGLLCNSCNMGIGILGDDPTRLEAAANYLREHDG